MKCPICHKNLTPFCKKANYQIYKCSNCGFGLTKNSKLQGNTYHRDEEYILEENLFKNIFEKRVEIISGLTKPGKVLEIGCSTGLLLSLLKKTGWEVLGVEVSKNAAEVAKSKGVEVIVETFENVKISQKFDLIILNHVLEHLKDPELILSKANNLLNDRGLILVSLPNFNSQSAKIQKENWPLLLPSEHLWHFTPQSLKLVLKREGFRVNYLQTFSGIWDYANPLKGIWISLTHFKKRFFGEIFWAIPTYILSKLGLGSGLIAVAKKN